MILTYKTERDLKSLGWADYQYASSVEDSAIDLQEGMLGAYNIRIDISKRIIEVPVLWKAMLLEELHHMKRLDLKADYACIPLHIQSAIASNPLDRVRYISTAEQLLREIGNTHRRSAGTLTKIKWDEEILYVIKGLLLDRCMCPVLAFTHVYEKINSNDYLVKHVGNKIKISPSIFNYKKGPYKALVNSISALANLRTFRYNNSNVKPEDPPKMEVVITKDILTIYSAHPSCCQNSNEELNNCLVENLKDI